jgi:hypothetical protein
MEPKAAKGAGLFMGIGGLRGGKIGADGKMHYNPGWEPGSMKTLAAHGLTGGIVQDRMGGSFGAGNKLADLPRNPILATTSKAVSASGSPLEYLECQNIILDMFRYLFNESMHHGQKQGIPISEYERRLAKKETQMSTKLT